MGRGNPRPGRVLVLVGTFVAPLSQWFVFWLLARSGGPGGPWPPVGWWGGGNAGGRVRIFVRPRPLQGGPPEFPDAAPQGFIEADALKNSGG